MGSIDYFPATINQNCGGEFMNYRRSPGFLLGYLIGRLLAFLGARLHDRCVIYEHPCKNVPTEESLDDASNIERLLRLQIAQYQAEKCREFFED